MDIFVLNQDFLHWESGISTHALALQQTSKRKGAL